MAHGAARAMLIVDYVGLNGVSAVSSFPTMKKAFVQEFAALFVLPTNGEKAQCGSHQSRITGSSFFCNWTFNYWFP